MKKGIVIFNDNIVSENSDTILLVFDRDSFIKSCNGDLYTPEMIENFETIDQFVPDDISLSIEDLRYLNVVELLKRHPLCLRSIYMYWCPNIAYEAAINKEYKEFIFSSLDSQYEVSNKTDTTMINIENEILRIINIIRCNIESQNIKKYLKDTKNNNIDKKIKSIEDLYSIARENGYAFNKIAFLEDLSNGKVDEYINWNRYRLIGG